MTQGESLGELLCAWFRREARDLPWRRERSPYNTLVCELMAQQTRIDTLLPYYERFVARWPDFGALAAADLDDVLKMWQGLGYYSRARNLHRCAREVVGRHGGELPADRAALLRLPGIGEYTAGAILSLGFNLPCPAVDGNALRVWSRVARDGTDISTPAAKRACAEWIGREMPPGRAALFTEGLMELGALVCAPRSPDCPRCPIRGRCAAARAGNPEDYPVRAPARAQREIALTMVLLRDPAGRTAMRKREERLLHGLWEYFWLPGDLSPEQVAEALARQGIAALDLRDLGRRSHVFTHRIWRLRGVSAVASEGSPAPEGYAWLTPEERAGKSIPAAFSHFDSAL